ncbi:hypothetical protein [Burkholderia gladioli]|uniref:hypothetical protein n=1 Tax=Burkholderia gladioli TaxID=28095 RepID=UPI00301752BA
MTNNTTALPDEQRIIEMAAEHGIGPTSGLGFARALLTSPRAAVPAPEGWKLVPIEATEGMKHAARDWSDKKYGKPIGNDAAIGCWGTMLDAAPVAPVASPSIDIEQMLRDCVPGGDIVDPQLVCDNIRGWFEDRASVAAAVAQSACRGKNCGATDGVSHSPECVAEHEAAVSGAVAADGAPTDYEKLLATVGTAYGYLWHINEMTEAPIPHYSPAKAAYASRRVLREFLTSEQRGIAINEVGREIGRFIDDAERAAVSPATATYPHIEPEPRTADEPTFVLGGNGRIGLGAPATADERAAFERWMVEDEKCIVGSTDPYPAGIERQNWKVWRAAWARASQAAAPAEAREPLVLWKDGTGMLWDTYSHGKWMHRVVSPHGWDAHGVAQHLYGKGYAGHLEVRAVWSGNYAVPADAGEAVFADDDERSEFEKACFDFKEDGETDVDYGLLMKWANAGLLECDNFQITTAGNAALAQGAQGGKGGEA